MQKVTALVFKHAVGDFCGRIFGVILWAAVVTSVVGAAYTSVSFIRSFHLMIEKYKNWITISFIVVSTMIFTTIGQPVKTLVLVGALNALILPLALGIMLVATHKKNIMGATYKHPIWLTVTGAIVVVVMAVLCVRTIIVNLSTLS